MKKILPAWIFGGFIVGTALCCAGAAAAESGARAAHSFRECYYFLVRACDEATAAAVAGESYVSGGAGYVTEDGTSVVLACYFESGEAARVQAQMLQNGVETAISERLSDAVVLSGEAARYSEAIAGNLQTADACARILYHAANGLERAAIGQNEASALLGFVASSLRGLPQGNSAKAFAPWNAALIHLADKVRSLTDGILFARDVRRAQVELCLQVVQAEKYFS